MIYLSFLDLIWDFVFVCPMLRREMSPAKQAECHCSSANDTNTRKFNRGDAATIVRIISKEITSILLCMCV